MKRCDYLTGAILRDGSSSNTYDDLVAELDDERIAAALKSGFTKALFNGVVAVKYASEPRLMLDLLTSINRNASNADEWRVVDEGQADIKTTLELIQMELLTSATYCGREALPLLSAALSTGNDSLHFAVFHGVRECRDPALVDLIESYIADFDSLEVREDSRSHLVNAATEALDSCYVT